MITSALESFLLKLDMATSIFLNLFFLRLYMRENLSDT